IVRPGADASTCTVTVCAGAAAAGVANVGAARIIGSAAVSASEVLFPVCRNRPAAIARLLGCALLIMVRITVDHIHGASHDPLSMGGIERVERVPYGGRQ